MTDSPVVVSVVHRCSKYRIDWKKFMRNLFIIQPSNGTLTSSQIHDWENRLNLPQRQLWLNTTACIYVVGVNSKKSSSWIFSEYDKIEISRVEFEMYDHDV